jgi:hypothetical protein
MRKELRASLEDARTIVAELEAQNLDAKLEIDFLKASPVVSDEVECVDCPIFLADLAIFKEKHASKCKELECLGLKWLSLNLDLLCYVVALLALSCIRKLMRCMLTLFRLRLSQKNLFPLLSLHVKYML